MTPTLPTPSSPAGPPRHLGATEVVAWVSGLTNHQLAEQVEQVALGTSPLDTGEMYLVLCEAANRLRSANVNLAGERTIDHRDVHEAVRKLGGKVIEYRPLARGYAVLWERDQHFQPYVVHYAFAGSEGGAFLERGGYHQTQDQARKDYLARS